MQQMDSELNDSNDRRSKSRLRSMNVALLLLSILCAILIIIVIVLAAINTNNSVCQEVSEENKLTKIHELYLKMTATINKNSFGKNLRSLTREIHVSGTPANQRVIATIYKYLADHALDEQWIETFDMPLSYPERGKENHVRILDETGVVKFQSEFKDYQYSAYTRSAFVRGSVIFANYGSESDFKALNQAGIQCCNNSVVFMRMGHLFRGQKVINAQKMGAVAAVLYPDPRDFLIEDPASGKKIIPPSKEFNEYAQLQPDFVVRGGIAPNRRELLNMLKPVGQSEPVAYDPSLLSDLPEIPCQPISYGEAKEFLKLLVAGPRDIHWGSLVDEVGIGPGYQNDSEYANCAIEVETHNVFQWANISNIFARFTGSEEPDRIIILGSHLDAWSYGAVDPNSGTSIIMELTRILSEMKKIGWRPRRTILLANWDAEEFGLLGSNKWVTTHISELQHSAVAYINLDVAINGNWQFSIDADNQLVDLILDCARRTRTENGESLYDEWLRRQNATGNLRSSEPMIYRLQPNSDQAPFAFFAGVSSMFPRYHPNENIYQYRYATYHTLADNLQGMETFYDPGNILTAQAIFEDRLSSVNATVLDQHHLNATPLRQIVLDFSLTASEFDKAIEKQRKQTTWSVLQQRIVNDAIMAALQSFVVARNKNDYLNILTTIGLTNRSPGYPLLHDALTKAIQSDAGKDSDAWMEVRRQQLLLEQRINQANLLLRLPFIKFSAGMQDNQTIESSFLNGF